MKEKIKEFGKFNGWRGCMGLYFNTKQLRPLEKVRYNSRYNVRRSI